MLRPAIVILCVFIFCGQAKGETVRAFVDRTQITIGESIHLTVSSSGGDAEVNLSPIKDFKVIPRGTSTNVQIVNGRMTREVRKNYTLIPLKEGSLKIPALTVSSDGTSYKTDEIIIQVSKQSGRSQRSENVFVTGRISKANPYVGEPIVYTFQLYNAVQIANGNFQAPSFSGFTAKEVKDRKTYRKVVSGRGYNVTELIFLLVPLSAGNKTIEPATLQCDIVRRKQSRKGSFDSFFNDPFFGSTELVPKIVRTDSIAVDVRALPPYDGPGNFSGLVGRFEIQADLKTAALKVGDSTTLTVVIKGNGNLMDAEKPEIMIPEEFKHYEDAPEEDIRAGTSGYSGTKAFRIALVPVKEGNFTVKPIQLVYFDASKGGYALRSTKPISLRVGPSDQKDKLDVLTATPKTVEPPNRLKRSVEFTGRDILPLKEGLDALENKHPMVFLRFVILLVLPIIFYIGVKVTFVFTRRDDHPAALMADRAEKALKAAGKAELSGEAFFSNLHRAVVSIILSKAGVKGESLTYAEACEILRSKDYPDETVRKAADLLERIESSRYSGLKMDEAFKADLMSETKQFFRSLSR